MAPTLEYLGGETIPLGDGTYRWVQLKRFRSRVTEPSTSQEVIVSLLAHPAYRDDLKHFDDGSVSSLRTAADPIHGPYPLSVLSPTSFEEITPARAVKILGEWIQHGRSGWLDGHGNPKPMPPIQDGVANAISEHVIQPITDAPR